MHAACHLGIQLLNWRNNAIRSGTRFWEEFTIFDRVARMHLDASRTERLRYQ